MAVSVSVSVCGPICRQQVLAHNVGTHLDHEASINSSMRPKYFKYTNAFGIYLLIKSRVYALPFSIPRPPSAHHAPPFYFVRISNGFTFIFSFFFFFSCLLHIFNLFWEKVDHWLMLSVQLIRWHFISFVQLHTGMLAARHGEHFFTCHHRAHNSDCVGVVNIYFSFALPQMRTNPIHWGFSFLFFLGFSLRLHYILDGRLIVVVPHAYCIEMRRGGVYFTVSVLPANAALSMFNYFFPTMLQWVAVLVDP